MKQISTTININEITFDEDLYPRSQYNWNTAYDYAQSMRAGAVFPPIVLASYQGKNILVDGKHRWEAYKSLKVTQIKVIILLGLNREQIYKEAVKYNISHGKGLSPYEKRRIALKLMEMKVKGSEISKLILIPEDKLEHFVAQRLVSSMTGEPIDIGDIENTAKEIGRAILKSSLKNFAGTSLSQEDFDSIQDTQEYLNTGSQTNLFKQVINILENGLLDRKNKELMVLVRKLNKLLKQYK